jgi:hypothetical protein
MENDEEDFDSEFNSAPDEWENVPTVETKIARVISLDHCQKWKTAKRIFKDFFMAACKNPWKFVIQCLKGSDILALLQTSQFMRIHTIPHITVDKIDASVFPIREWKRLTKTQVVNIEKLEISFENYHKTFYRCRQLAMSVDEYLYKKRSSPSDFSAYSFVNACAFFTCIYNVQSKKLDQPTKWNLIARPNNKARLYFLDFPLKHLVFPCVQVLHITWALFDFQQLGYILVVFPNIVEIHVYTTDCPIPFIIMSNAALEYHGIKLILNYD